jgi:hypothetical protein
MQPPHSKVWHRKAPLAPPTKLIRAEMEVGAILGLIGSATAIVKAVYMTSSGLNDVLNALRNADKNITRLAAQLELFGVTIEELTIWLKQNPTLSSRLERAIRLSLNSCEVVISDLKECVTRVKPSKGETRSGFMKKVRLLWNENAIMEHERMLSTQFQMFTVIIGLKGLYVTLESRHLFKSCRSNAGPVMQDAHPMWIL